VNTTFDLLAHDLLNASFWMDVRKAQDASRNFGDGPTAAWTALRKIVPVLPVLDGSPSQSRPMTVAAFLRTSPASKFYSGGEPMPASSEKQ
jgi:histidine ammonia-lyase